MEHTLKVDQYFEGLKKKALKCASSSALKGEIEEVKRWAQIADQCAGALQTLDQLREIAGRVEGLLATDSVGTEKKADAPSEKYRASRLAASVSRQRWVDKVKATAAIALTQIRTTVYSAADGKRIGIGFGNQSSKYEGRWFASLADEPYDVMVLICRDANGTDLDFVIPVRELGDNWQWLSRQGNQIKLNISRKKDNFFLQVPGEDHPSVDISSFLGRIEPVFNAPTA